MEARIQQRYSFGPFVLDPVEKVLLREGRRLTLPPKALETLLTLVENHGHIVEKGALLERVWPDTFVEEATLAQNIFTLRKALDGSAGGSQYIETVPRRGYRFIARVELIEAQPQNFATADRAASRRSSRALLRTVAAAGAAALLLAGAVGIYFRGKSRGSFAEPAAGPVTLAVLPFANFSGDAAQDYLSDGLTDEMIAQLSRVNPERLRVIARTTAMQYKGTRKSVAQVGSELHADYILESSFRREGNRARITTQLVRSSDQTHIWSQNYERDVREILPLETEVAEAITREIAITLSPQAQARLAVRRAINPEAYESYLEGRFFWNKRTEEGHLKAIDYFQKALGVEPHYAQAYSGLADAYALLGSNPSIAITRPEAMSKARAAALQALAIDDSLAEAHTSLAFVYWHYDWNWPAAEKGFLRAIQLNPSYPTAHHWYAFYLVSQGRTEEGLAEIRLAQQIDPLSLIINTDAAQILYFDKRYDEAIAQSRHVLEMDPNFSLARLILVWSYLAQRQSDLALEEAKKGAGVSGVPLHTDVNLAITYAAAGQPARARALLRRVSADTEAQRISVPFGIAQAYAALGDKEQAFAWLEKDFQAHDGGLTMLKAVPFFEGLRADPRFADLVRRIGLP